MGIRSLAAAAASISAAFGLWFMTSGWVFYADDRQPSHSSLVGTLETDLPEGRGAGTAVLVDECGILTNFHVVFGPWYVTALRPPSREFRATFTLTEVMRPDGSHPVAQAAPVVWGDYLGPDRQFRRPDQDWTYLVLDRCLGSEHGHFNLRSLDDFDLELSGEGFAAIGYSAGRQMMDPVCSAHAGRSAMVPGIWLHDCALMGGDSGGPIVKRGTTTLVALGSGFRAASAHEDCHRAGPDSRPDYGCANFAVPLSRQVLDRVEAARIATSVQRALNRLGYDAGPLGAIDDPRLARAIADYQRGIGVSVTGEPSDLLATMLCIQLTYR